MPVILLVRHGQASFGEADYDRLSALGRRQSQVVGQELAHRSLRNPMLVCGTLRRQRDTAAIAVAEAGLVMEPMTDPRWNEYDHADLLKHLRPATGEEASPASSRDLQVLLDEALLAWVQEGSDRGWGAFSEGARSALEELIATIGPGRDGVVFTSGGVVAAICAGLLDGSAKTVVALNRMAINSSITKLIAGPSGISLASFNEHAHLKQSEVTFR
jgi:broad specificity phosphatase PhoE